MTEEQKEILIAKMLDAPSSLSDEELDAILHDDELRDIHAASSAVSSACVRQPEPDMEAEWKRFRQRIIRKPSAMRRAMRVAAIFLGVIFASGIAVRIINNVFTHSRQPVIAEADRPRESNKPIPVQQNTQTAETKDKPRIEPATDKSHPAVSTRHLAKAEITKPKTTDSHVNTDIDIDIDEYIRIQQARMDNELSLQIAEYYMEEYDNIVPILDAAGIYNPRLDNIIRKVTTE